MIYKEKPDLAYEYLNNFSDLVRSVITNANEINWTIAEEIEFIATYLKLENVRYDNKFEISITNSLLEHESFRMPKLMIQTFVENAIKHGLVHRDAGGRLSLEISRTADHIRFVVTDNGIGRAEAAKLEQSGNRRGLKIVGDYIDFYNRINRDKFVLNIVDVCTKEGTPSGTRVEISIPLTFNG
jgi:sensor histidine kinase YesM